MALDALSQLVRLGEDEKHDRGLVDTPREIAQQPRTWPATFERVAALRPDLEAFLERAGVRLADGVCPSVVLVGAGSSDFVGRSLVHLLRKRWRTHVEAIPSTDLLTNLDDLVAPTAPNLWISFSRSGDSSEAVAVLEAALDRFPSAHHLLVTCNAEGRFATGFASDSRVFPVVLDEAVNDRGLAMTSSFTNMVVAGQCLAHLEDLGEVAPVVDALARTAAGLLEPAADLAAALAGEPISRVLFLGTGPSGAAATESALKVLELTAGRIWSAAESYLGVRHGPLSALDGSTLVVAIMSRDGRRQAYERDLIAEIRAKGLAKFCLVVDPCASAPDSVPADLVLSSGTPREVPDDYRPPLDVVFGQLLGLFASVRHGLRPDAPSPNGAIGRVVSSVSIYR